MCNCKYNLHEYSAKYLEKKAKEKIMKKLEEEQKAKDGTSTEESNSR